MKTKFLLILSLICLCLSILFSIINRKNLEFSLVEALKPNILRFHVLANSDEPSDQEIKLEVRSLILDLLREKLPSDSTKETTVEYVETHTYELESLVNQHLNANGFSYGAELLVQEYPFPEKTYGNLTFPKGTYDAVRIILGKGNGENWWCVLYPQFCFVGESCTKIPSDSLQILEEILTEEQLNLLKKQPSSVTYDFYWLSFNP